MKYIEIEKISENYKKKGLINGFLIFYSVMVRHVFLIACHSIKIQRMAGDQVSLLDEVKSIKKYNQIVYPVPF